MLILAKYGRLKEDSHTREISELVYSSLRQLFEPRFPGTAKCLSSKDPMEVYNHMTDKLLHFADSTGYTYRSVSGLYFIYEQVPPKNAKKSK